MSTATTSGLFAEFGLSVRAEVVDHLGEGSVLVVEERRGGAELDDAACVQHEGLVVVDDRVQPVRDRQEAVIDWVNREAGAYVECLNWVLTTFWIWASAAASTWAVGSSMHTTFAPRTRTRAMARSCRSPIDREESAEMRWFSSDA